MNKIADITFTAAEVNAFREASFDLNPLHTDAEYARRSPFGQPVVYGVLAVLKVLGKWKMARGHQLKSIRAVFKKPFFQGEAYQLCQEKRGDQVFLSLKRGPVDYMHLTVASAPLEFEKGDHSLPFEPLSQSLDTTQQAARNLAYSPNAEAAGELRSLVGIGQNQVSNGQLAALLWASYQVGMELPGRQALFAELQVEFRTALHGLGIRLDLGASDFDDRFNRISVEGTGSGLSKVRIVAFRRPEAVVPDWEGWASDAVSQEMAGKRVFISGAGRGFGAALAIVAGMQGAKIALNYRTAGPELDRLVDFLKGRGIELLCVQGDLSKGNDVKAVAAEIESAWGGLDVVVNNAYPSIRNLYFFEQDHQEMMGFLGKTMEIMLLTARHLLPLVAENGAWLQVSTAYVAEPVKGFSHYNTSKAAQEALCQSLSLEQHHCNFVVARLPQMLTDQTNLPFHLRLPANPGTLATAVLKALFDNREENYSVVDLF